MGLKDGICARCRRVDKNCGASDPGLFTAENMLYPGLVPSALPALTSVEEMLIARVHVFIEVRQVRGQQFKYKGHVVNFLQNTGHIYDTLLLLPKDLNMVLIRPSNAADNPQLDRQFRRDYRVRQGAVRSWLSFLRYNHPGYRSITIDQQTLDQLPVNGDVMDQMTTRTVDAEEIDEVSAADIDDEQPPETAAVPDMAQEDSEMEELRRQLGLERDHLSMPSVRSTPLSEFNRSQSLLSWAFPTLFPRGEADFVVPRLRSVTYAEYIKHLLKFEDGRFARHPRFRYVVFNTMMRNQVNSRAGYFVRRAPEETQALSIADLRAAFEDDTAESDRLLNGIYKDVGSYRTVRSYRTVGSYERVRSHGR